MSKAYSIGLSDGISARDSGGGGGAAAPSSISNILSNLQFGDEVSSPSAVEFKKIEAAVALAISSEAAAGTMQVADISESSSDDASATVTITS